VKFSKTASSRVFLSLFNATIQFDPTDNSLLNLLQTKHIERVMSKMLALNTDTESIVMRGGEL
jgi:hypothetical protein